MAVSYDPTKDPFGSCPRTDPQRFGLTGSNLTITGSDLQLNVYGRIQVVVAGTLQVLPAMNDDAEWVNLFTQQPGYIVPFQVRAIKGGSTATVVFIGV